MRLLSLAALIFLLVSCNNQNNKPDVSNIKVDVTIDRFEQTFFSIDTNQLTNGLTATSQKFPNFYPIFMNEILLLKNAHSFENGQVSATPEGDAVCRNFIRGYRPIFDSINKKYNSLIWLKEELTTAFKYVNYYYPSYKAPKVITFIGTFDAPGVILTQHYLGIGLHQYAGKNFSVYKDPQIQEMYPEYISRRFDKEYMTANCIKSIVDDLYTDSTVGRPLIEQMIEKGKQWYLLDKFLPDTPDSIKTGYQQKQLNWVKENEGNVWGFITKNTDIFTIDPEIIQGYIGEGPFTQGMPETVSPGNIGQWVGWQIVKTFAEKNPKLSVQQILATPAKNLFQEAKYKPK